MGKLKSSHGYEKCLIKGPLHQLELLDTGGVWKKLCQQWYWLWQINIVVDFWKFNISYL